MSTRTCASMEVFVFHIFPQRPTIAQIAFRPMKGNTATNQVSNYRNLH